MASTDPKLAPNGESDGDPKDGMSRAAADKLAESINRYWAGRGYDAEARAVETRLFDGHGSAGEFAVVSNLRNGVPSRRLSDGSDPGVTR